MERIVSNLKSDGNLPECKGKKQTNNLTASYQLSASPDSTGAASLNQTRAEQMGRGRRWGAYSLAGAKEH